MAPGAVRREVADGLVPGLYLVVQTNGVKSWALRYRIERQTRKLTLGPALTERKGPAAAPSIGQALTLAEARNVARRALQEVAEGTDPSRAKQAIKAATRSGEDRVDTQARDFIERHCKRHNRSWREVERQFRIEIVPNWGSRRVQDIGRRDIIALIDDIVAHGAPIQANRVLATLSRFFSWLVERDVLKTSPAAGIRKPSPETSRDRVLSNGEIAALWKASGAVGYPFGTLVRLLLLTGQRRNEAAGMRWSELDRDRKEWMISAERSKNGKAHTVPLSEAAFAEIDAIPRVEGQDLLLSTTGITSISGFSKAKRRLNQAMQAEIAAWSLHDLRRTAASGMARLGVNLPVIEKVLNHMSGSFSGVVGIYNRHDFANEQRTALEAWAECVLEIAEGEPARLSDLPDDDL